MRRLEAEVRSPSPRRPIGVGSRELGRRLSETYRRIGTQIADLRLEAGISQAELARCAGIAQSYLWRIEAGFAQPSVQVLVAVGACLGADFGARYFPGTGPRLRDRFQAPIVEALIRELGSPWRAQPELPVPAARGVIDVVLSRPADGCVLACECHSELRRLEIVLRRLGEKAEALGGQLNLEHGASRLLLLRSTEATRAIARAYEATLAAAFPGRTADALAALRGDAAWPGSAIVWAKIERAGATMLEGPPRGVRVGR